MHVFLEIISKVIGIKIEYLIVLLISVHLDFGGRFCLKIIMYTGTSAPEFSFKWLSIALAFLLVGDNFTKLIMLVLLCYKNIDVLG